VDNSGLQRKRATKDCEEHVEEIRIKKHGQQVSGTAGGKQNLTQQHKTRMNAIEWEQNRPH